MRKVLVGAMGSMGMVVAMAVAVVREPWLVSWCDDVFADTRLILALLLLLLLLLLRVLLKVLLVDLLLMRNGIGVELMQHSEICACDC